MQDVAEPKQPGMFGAVARRAALGLLGAMALPIGGDAAQAAEARLGRRLARSLGRGQAAQLVADHGAEVAGLDPGRLDQRCADDFRAGRTLLVGGVLVARTEAVGWLLAAGFPAA